MLSKKRQTPSHRGRADIVEQDEYFVVFDQANGVLDRRQRIVAVVISLDCDLAAVNAASLVDMVKIDLRPTVQFDAQPATRSRERSRHADDDVVRCSPLAHSDHGCANKQGRRGDPSDRVTHGVNSRRKIVPMWCDFRLHDLHCAGMVQTYGAGDDWYDARDPLSHDRAEMLRHP